MDRGLGGVPRAKESPPRPDEQTRIRPRRRRHLNPCSTRGKPRAAQIVLFLPELARGGGPSGAEGAGWGGGRSSPSLLGEGAHAQHGGGVIFSGTEAVFYP